MTSDDNDDETELQLVYRDFERLREVHAELLAAAKIVYRVIEGDGQPAVSTPEEIGAAIDNLRAAIAKAEQV